MNDKRTLPLLSIIIPVLHLKRPANAKRFFMPRYTLREVLRDLEENVKIPFEVIVVCNGTSPELVEFVRNHQGIAKYCINKVNVGVARSWNMGAQMAEGRALCFLNDDVAVGAGAFEALYERLFSGPDVGEVGPTGALWQGARHDRFVGEERVEEADAIAGYCFMLRADLYRRIGGFDVAFTPAGFEEIDMSFAVRKAGFRCVVVPKLIIHHYHHHGVSAYRSKIDYLGGTIDTVTLHERNKAYFKEKWGIDDVA